MSPRSSTVVLTSIAMLAFAGNSVLCRAALAPGEQGPAIDGVAFTAVRLASGAAVLAPTLWPGRARGASARTGAASPGKTALCGAMLLTYALAFSLSYASLPAGVGALILFGSVQLTMLGAARLEGEVVGPRRWFGAAVAFGGLLVLMAPSPSSLVGVDPRGAALMALAGVGWGVYTLLGRASAEPIRAALCCWSGRSRARASRSSSVGSWGAAGSVRVAGR